VPDPEISIRPATARDVGAVRDIVERAYGVYVQDIGRRPVPMDADYELAVRDGTVFVAEAGGALAGLVVLVLEPGHVLIENVAVEPGRQHLGIGRALLAFAEGHARRHGRATLRLYTHEKMLRNQRLYAELGYVRTEPPAGDTTPRVFMEKLLRGDAARS
jgi:ribosomal protein S18 acetylase RimI-like enzyme